jgi:hypothetical protein
LEGRILNDFIPKADLGLEEFLAVDRWMMDNGLVSDSVQQNLFGYACLCHPDVLYGDVEIKIDAEKRQVFYTIPLNKGYRSYVSYKKKMAKLENATSLFGLWRKARLLKKHRLIDVEMILGRFVKDYLGDGWKVEVEVVKK